MNNTNKFVSVPEAARLVGVSRQYILEVINLGKIPAFKIGKSYAIDLQDLEKFKEKRKTKKDNVQSSQPEKEGYPANTSTPQGAKKDTPIAMLSLAAATVAFVACAEHPDGWFFAPGLAAAISEALCHP